MQTYWAYILSGFLGGVMAIVALIVALAIVSKGSNSMTIHFGGKEIEFYKEIELIETAIRPGGIYVKYKNTGNKTATTACFRVRINDQNNRLIAESEEVVNNDISPGETRDNVISSRQLQHDWIQNPDYKIDVVFLYAYLE